MKTELTAQRIERYRERGFLRLDRFLAADEYMPDGTTYNGQRNILTDEQVARLRPGSPLDDESQNPVVWSRTRAPTFA